MVPIISVTGTKGKTTTVAIIADVLQKLNHNVVKVDTTGHFINGEQRSNLDDSKRSWGLVPTVSPGRYLWEFYKNPKLTKEGVAVLECALGCSAGPGTGYKLHTVGVFLNVFKDHLGSNRRLQTQKDIARAKAFIFERIDKEGWAVFNADDELVCQTLSSTRKDYGIKLLPFGLKFDHFNLKNHLSKGGKALTVKENKVILLSRNSQREIYDLESVPFTFQGLFQPSLYNLLAATSAIYAFNGGKFPRQFKEILESIKLDPYNGRLASLRAANGTKIIADYAHEKVSLVEVAHLARGMVLDKGKLIGVIRIAHDRTDRLIKSTGHAIAKEYDGLIVYDKIDGYWKKPIKTSSTWFPEITGRTSKILTEAIKDKNPSVKRIVREDQAIAYAAKIAGPNDVVVIIVNDDIKRSIGFIKQSFKAKLV